MLYSGPCWRLERCFRINIPYVTVHVSTDVQVMDEFFQPICEATLKYRESREVVIRKAVITLLPNMATFDPDRFEDLYLKNAMSYILQSLHKATDRDIGMYRHYFAS